MPTNKRGMPNDWSDFPRRKGPDGRWLCRRCGRPLEGRKVSWCSQECLNQVLLLCDWRYIRRQVKKRDRYACVLCGRRRRDGHRLDVDHTVEVQDGGLSVMDNLRTLCWICHKVKTAEMRRKRAEARKNPTAGQPVQVYNGIEGARHPIGR